MDLEKRVISLEKKMAELEEIVQFQPVSMCYAQETNCNIDFQRMIKSAIVKYGTPNNVYLDKDIVQ